MTAVIGAIGLIGGVIGFFRSIAAGKKAAAAQTEAALARGEAGTALARSAAAAEESAASLKRSSEFVEHYAPRASLDAIVERTQYLPFSTQNADGSRDDYESATFRVKVRNNGNGAAYDVVVAAPAGGGGVNPPRRSLPTIPPNEEVDHSFTVTRVPSATTTLTITWRYHPSPETFSTMVEL